jgi:ribose transport system substrate-binding protein
MRNNYRRSLLVRVGGVFGAGALLLAGLVGLSANATSAAAASKTYKVAVLLASSDNGYNQAVATGVKEYVRAHLGGKVTIKVLGADFSSTTQLSQLENATINNVYSGVIIVPNDGTTLSPAFPTGDGAPVVTVLDPIGPKWNDMQPQVKGVISTVAVPVSSAAAKQTIGVIDYCKTINPCNVAIIVGDPTSSLDHARVTAYDAAFSGHSNIKVVATMAGAYDPATSDTAMANALVANPKINALITTGDQMTEGAQIALQAKSISPSSLYMTGEGGTYIALKDVRNGSWKSDYINFPVTMGENAMEQLYNSLTKQPVKTWVNADQGPTAPYATKATLKLTPSFKGQWAG